jgi:two-component system chemotaxis response regulator CheY
MKILVAEDDSASRLLMQQLLKSYGEVDTAINGRDAIAIFHLAMAQGESYHLVFLDIMMPEVDGHGVLREIRKMDDKENPARVIMTTALANLENVTKAIKESCDAYIVKPITKAVLIDKMRSVGLPMK